MWPKSSGGFVPTCAEIRNTVGLRAAHRIVTFSCQIQNLRYLMAYVGSIFTSMLERDGRFHGPYSIVYSYCVDVLYIMYATVVQVCFA